MVTGTGLENELRLQVSCLTRLCNEHNFRPPLRGRFFAQSWEPKCGSGHAQRATSNDGGRAAIQQVLGYASDGMRG